MRPGRPRSNAIRPHRTGDVFERLLADVLEGAIETPFDLVAHDRRNTDPARLGQGFETCRDIDPVAKDIVAVLDDVAEVDPHAEEDSPRLGYARVAFGHPLLHLERAAHRIDDAPELDQKPIARGLDDAAPVLLDLGVAELPANRLQHRQRPFLVRAHQTRIADDIGGQDRGKPAALGHAVSPIARRRPDRRSC